MPSAYPSSPPSASVPPASSAPAPAPVPRWWRWLSSADLRQQAVHYIVLVVAVNVLAWGLVGLAGGNVLDRRLPIVLFPLSGFVIWAALAFYRRRRDTTLGFGRALKLGALIAAGSSGGLAILLGALVVFGGETLRARHVATTVEILRAQQQRLETLADGKAVYAAQLAAAQHIAPGTLVVDELIRRLLPALLTALLGAILLRKANPDGTEPERAPRPPKVAPAA